MATRRQAAEARTQPEGPCVDAGKLLALDKSQCVRVYRSAKRQLIIGLDDWRDWLATARPGQRVQYYQGELAVYAARSRLVRELARAVATAHRDGLVLLFQRRLAEGVSAYVAVRAGAARASMLSSAGQVAPLISGVIWKRHRAWLERRLAGVSVAAIAAADGVTAGAVRVALCRYSKRQSSLG